MSIIQSFSIGLNPYCFRLVVVESDEDAKSDADGSCSSGNSVCDEHDTSPVWEYLDYLYDKFCKLLNVNTSATKTDAASVGASRKGAATNEPRFSKSAES